MSHYVFYVIIFFVIILEKGRWLMIVQKIVVVSGLTWHYPVMIASYMYLWTCWGMWLKMLILLLLGLIMTQIGADYRIVIFACSIPFILLLVQLLIGSDWPMVIVIVDNITRCVSCADRLMRLSYGWGKRSLLLVLASMATIASLLIWMEGACV